jgi:hypothetical protein
LIALLTVLCLAGCDGGHHRHRGDDAQASTFSVGGGVSGLGAEGLVLQNNGGDALTVPANAATFQFATPVAAGGSYAVTVAAQPAGRTCTVTRGTGSIVSAAVTDISVVCHVTTRTIAGTIAGLTTNGLVLRNNGADDLTVAANATTFQYATPIATGSGYSVTTFAQPAGLTCTVSDGVGSNVNADIHDIHIACSAVTFTIGGTIVDLSAGGLVLQNNGGDNLVVAANSTAFEFATPVAYGGGYDVTVLTQPVGQFCSVSAASGTSITTPVSNIALTCSPVALTACVSSIALAVNNTSLNAALTGTPRIVTIANPGSVAAINVAIDYPVWPVGTTASSTCGSMLAAGDSCTITVTPGASATSNCGIGIAPTPGTITVTAANAPASSSIHAVVLSYGCIYQAGYLFGIDDTTADSGSIGGKVISLNDQAAPYISLGPQATSIIWSSNGLGYSAADISEDTIPGIDETSTVSNGSPTYLSFEVALNATYSNAPSLAPNAFQACNGSDDGACNSGNILALYNVYVTGYGIGASPFTAAPGPTSLHHYAAGLCGQTINAFSDWYLPAICEMGAGGGGASCAGEQSVSTNLPFLIGDPGALTPSTSCTPSLGTECFAGAYWSSTQASVVPNVNAWAQTFAPGSSYAAMMPKNASLGVRCARTLTQ